MPIFKRRPHVVELLNIAVEHRKKLTDTRTEILDRPPNIWYHDNETPKLSRQPSFKGFSIGGKPGEINTNYSHMNMNVNLNTNMNTNANISSIPFEMPAAFSRQPSMHVPEGAIVEKLSIKYSPHSRQYAKFIEYFGQLFINYSRACQRILYQQQYRRLKMLLWPITFSIMIYEVQRGDYHIINSTTMVLSILDTIINIGFMIDAMLRFSGFYMFIRVEQAFNRNINYIEMIRQCGILDIIITSICFYYSISTMGLWLRLIRLIIITSAVLEVFPYIDVLMSSMHNGLKTTIFTIALLFLLILSYGSIGYFLFKKNDPFHFGSYFLSCLTFFQMTTFENWSTYLYINFYGCDAFSADYNYSPPIDSNITLSDPIQTQFGYFYLPYCINPSAQPIATTLVFISYELLAGFGVIAMCLAAVAIGINERLNELRCVSLYGENDEDHINSLGAVLQLNKYNSHNTIRQRSIIKLNQILGATIEVEGIKDLMKRIWDGQNIQNTIISKHYSMIQMLDWSTIKSFTSTISLYMRSLLDSRIYMIIITMTILSESILQMMEETMNTSNKDVVGEESKITIFLHLFFEIIFIIDVLITGMSYVYHIKQYIHDFWAIYDILLTIILFFPAIMPAYTNFQILKYIRIFRLFRILKTASLHFSDLNVILGAISGSFWAVIYVICLIFLFFSYYAIAGVLLLKHADPWYYGSISRAMKTLLQVMTLDNWSEIMRNGIFGCYLFGYNTGYKKFDNTCNHHDIHAGMGWFAAIYYISFIIVAAIILNSLFVGVIISSMELLKESLDDENDQWRKVNAVKNRYNISEPTLDLLLQLFEKLDVTEQASISFEDMKPLMNIVNMPQSDQYAFFVLVDTDHSGTLDFAEFSEMIVLMGLSHSRTKEKGLHPSNYDKTVELQRESKSSIISYESVCEIHHKKQEYISPNSSIRISLKSMKETFQMSFDTLKSVSISPTNSILPLLSSTAASIKRPKIYPTIIDSELIDLAATSAAASVSLSSRNNRRQSNNILRKPSKSSFDFMTPRIIDDGERIRSSHSNDNYSDIESQSIHSRSTVTTTNNSNYYGNSIESTAMNVSVDKNKMYGPIRIRAIDMLNQSFNEMMTVVDSNSCDISSSPPPPLISSEVFSVLSLTTKNSTDSDQLRCQEECNRKEDIDKSDNNNDNGKDGPMKSTAKKLSSFILNDQSSKHQYEHVNGSGETQRVYEMESIVDNVTRFTKVDDIVMTSSKSFSWCVEENNSIRKYLSTNHDCNHNENENDSGSEVVKFDTSPQ